MKRHSVDLHYKFKDTDFMDKMEIRHFKNLEKAGLVSIFRLKKCDFCGKLTPNTKKYCSIDCKIEVDGEEEEEEI